MREENKRAKQRLIAQAEQLEKIINETPRIAEKGRREFKNAHQQRLIRGKQNNEEQKPIFLRPQDIEKGLKYDIEKVYFTTLNGQYRQMTQADLRAIEANIKTLKDQYQGGITAKNIINLSLPIDVERCNKEILSLVPLSLKNGVVEFLTGASGKYKERSHRVNVEFLKYNSFNLSPDAPTIANVKRDISLGKLRFEFDCGRHTYWYRYMATLGGYGYGYKEEGFPKERNPNMVGLACKHVLRVMQHIQTPLFQAYLLTNLKKERSSQIGTRLTSTKPQALKHLNEQRKHATPVKNREVKINNRAKIKEAEARLKRHGKALQDQQAKRISKRENISEEKAKQRLKADAKIQLQGLLKRGLIGEEAYKTLLQGLK